MTGPPPDEDSRWFRRATAATGHAIVITAAEIEPPGPAIRFVNAAMCALTGYAKHELLGATPRIVQGPETDRAVLAALKRALRAGQGFAGETVNYRKDGTRYVVAWTIDPIRDSAGTIEGWIGVLRDVSAERRVDAQRAAADARLRAIFSAASVGLSEVDQSGRFLRVNQELCRLLGRDETELLRLGVADVTEPPYLAPSDAAVAAALTSGRTTTLDKCYHRPDGSTVWANSSITPLGEAGDPARSLLVVTIDLTARKRAEAALRESEARFREFGTASTDALWVRDARDLRVEYASPAFERLYGLPLAAVGGPDDLRRVARLILPADRPAALDAVRRVRAGATVTAEFRVRRAADGAVRWVRDTAFPIRDAEGRVHRIGGISEDATAAKASSDRLEVLVAELQHRTRNLLGVVRGLSNQLIASSASLDDFAGRFDDRLSALARVNGLLARLSEGDRITFDELARSELESLGGTDWLASGRVTMAGPLGVRLRSSTVQTFALALHELATNALKYGALSPRGGRLALDWRVAQDGGVPMLHVTWHESGVARDPLADATAPGGGYGRELIEHALPYQLGARTHFALRDDGVDCEIALPVSRGTESASASARAALEAEARRPPQRA
ncbi:PAS domain S-box protein [Sphingomonas sp. BK580]|uniref:PAS domain-containing sensor histidine kinase n=1 Tax=Sphingomonas sp. BK580 TaxID=2586972 RepID=UPI0016149572|nr:PAS domain S-box protein [Sphingomonas sp. BK580]MBB3695402.1 two-component system CheB/CheR fusion protein [Sphingomonas sp. BK580]